ncbi:MAG TPA: hypothetical protein VLJ37_02645 [bacterium]|nr:hypothetical protein [bacterium]
MSSLYLSTGQSQLLAHVMAWGNLRVAEIADGPFASPRLNPRQSTQSLMLPSAMVLRYLDRVKGHESRLLTDLGIDVKDLEQEVAKPDGPSFNHYIWVRNPAWLGGDLITMARIAMDDLWQIRQARINIHERIMRWKRIFGAQETMDARPNVTGLQNHLTWLQETYSVRHSYASDLIRHFNHGWDLVQAFYDPAARAAQNILEGGLALQHYLKVKVPPV